MKCYAHSRPNAPVEEWQTLEEHLHGVADRAAEFADPFSSSKWGRLIGLLHDIGKSRKSFQSYLLRSNDIEDAEPDYGNHSHSGVGGCWISQNAGTIGKILSYCIVGHHGGLPDWSGGDKPDGSLVQRLENERKMLEELLSTSYLPLLIYHHYYSYFLMKSYYLLQVQTFHLL